MKVEDLDSCRTFVIPQTSEQGYRVAPQDRDRWMFSRPTGLERLDGEE